MNKLFIILVIIFTVNFVFAGNDGEALQFKAKIGFTSGEDRIEEYKFLDSDEKLLIIGQKNLQIWDVKNAKLLNSVPHRIPQFAPRGFVSTYLLLGLPRFLDWRPFLVDPDGKWMMTAEKVGDSSLRSAVVRDLQTLRQIAVLDLPNVSTEYISFDEQKNEILTFGITDKNAAFADWDKDDFKIKNVVSIREYKWRQTIQDERKMIVGSGDTKVVWTSLGLNAKQGDTLTLRDAKTGAIEKEYTARNLKPDTAFQETTVSPDEKFLISKRDDRIFVWKIDADGTPEFEISQPNPKGDFSLKGIYGGKHIVVKINEQLRVYDAAGNGAAKLAVAFDNPQDSVEFCDLTDDGKYLAVRDDWKVSVYSVNKASGDGKPLYEIVRQSEKERFPVVKFLKEKNLLAVARVNRSEKKAPKTEFYDIPTGKLIFDAAFAADDGIKFTADGKRLYQTELGAFSVWNIAARRLVQIGLETYVPSFNSNAPNYIIESPSNTEYAEFSPDYRYILRHGDDVTAVFDTETGEQLQTIFDAAKVKYDKRGKIKKSGLGSAGWTSNGKYVYALESGILRDSKTVSLWEVK